MMNIEELKRLAEAGEAANPAAILAMIAERDELLAALKACRKELSAWMRDHGEDIATQGAVAQARAIIAKVED